MSKKKTTEKFIEESRKVHGDKYDYSKVEYISNRKKVCIICPEHGEFWQIAGDHLIGCGCTKCSKKYMPSTNEWMILAKQVHGDKYDYSKVNYINNHTKVCIICPQHGEFLQTPISHLKGNGCQICAGKLRKTTEQFVKESKEIHGDKYDYSNVNYLNNKTKVCVICPEHGEFWQIPKHHLNGHGCPFCSNRFNYANEEFVSKAISVHGNRYNYSKINYISSHKKICIICPEHGEFWQIAYMHLQGQGCPKCNQSHLENEVEQCLKEKSIRYFNGHSPDWLGKQHLDFYLPDYNVAIECQGEQHYQPVKIFGGEQKFIKMQELDQRKLQLCNENGIKLLYFTHYPNINEEGNIYKNKDKLLEEILHNVKSIRNITKSS